MDIFDSEWLIRMLDKSSKSPQGRILSLFDILQDWLGAPNIQIKISQDLNSYQNLINYIEKQAVACNAESPNHLAMQIVLIALTATFEEINQPTKGSLTNAKEAGSALLIAYTQNNKLVKSSNPVFYGIAASFMLLLINLSIWSPEFAHFNQSESYLAKTENIHKKNTINAQYHFKDYLSPIDVTIMYDKYERLRNGICQYPEVLTIPDKDRAIYLENVVGGQLPRNAEELRITNFYIEKVDCYYSPFLNPSLRS